MSIIRRLLIAWSAATVALGLAVSPVAFAQNKDSMSKDSMSKDDTAKDKMDKDKMSKDKM